jgi:hypothetical protein
MIIKVIENESQHIVSFSFIRVYIYKRTKDEYDIIKIKNDITIRGMNKGGYLDDIDETISSMNHL